MMQAESLREAGINMVWLPPAYKGAAGPASVGYDVYDMYDLGEFDQKGSVRTKYGTKDEYLAAVQALQQNGIAVLCDVVLNHRMGADGTERVTVTEGHSANRNQDISGKQQITAWTKFNFLASVGTLPISVGRIGMKAQSEMAFSVLVENAGITRRMLKTEITITSWALIWIPTVQRLFWKPVIGVAGIRI